MDKASVPGFVFQLVCGVRLQDAAVEPGKPDENTGVNGHRKCHTVRTAPRREPSDWSGRAIHNSAPGLADRLRDRWVPLLQLRPPHGRTNVSGSTPNPSATRVM